MKQQLMSLENISPRYITVALLAIWMSVYFLFGFIRTDHFNIDEGAALSLLLDWSISDQIANPIFVLGVPDFRALIYAPLGIYWPGNIVAAKILSMVIGFFAVLTLFRWSRQTEHTEAPMIAAVLTLLSPFLLNQIDSMGPAPILLLIVGLAAILNERYRSSDRPFGAWYFLQLLLIAISVSIHPIALAYPAVLAWAWVKQPHATKNARHILIGIAVATGVSLAIKGGWSNIEFFSNPVKIFSQVLSGATIYSEADINWIAGIISFILIAFVMISDFAFLRADFIGRISVLVLIIGLPMADTTWGVFLLAVATFRLVSILIRFNQSRNRQSFIGQRGFIVAFSFVCAVFFMFQLKMHGQSIKFDILSPEDEVIQALAAIASDESQPFRAASQWPARTMLVSKRDVLHLPPGYEKPEDIVSNALVGLTHLAFDPNNKKNEALKNTLASIPGETETYALMKGGVILKTRNNNVKLYIRPNVSKSDESQTDTDNVKESATPNNSVEESK